MSCAQSTKSRGPVASLSLTSAPTAASPDRPSPPILAGTGTGTSPVRYSVQNAAVSDAAAAAVASSRLRSLRSHILINA